MWVRLTAEQLKARLTNVELQALSSIQTDSSDVIADVIATVVPVWRSAVKRYSPIHKDRAFVPDELMDYILADVRYKVITRLPGMKSLLDDLRVKEWEAAQSIKRDLAKFVFDPPADADLENPGSGGKPGPLVGEPERHTVI